MKLWAFSDEDLKSILRSRKEPCFLYRQETLQRSWQQLRQAFGPRVILAYAVKANPFPPLLAALAQWGASFDCASAGELQAVAPFALNRQCFFTGPAKSEEEIRLALSLGLRLHVESQEDLVQFARHAGAEVRCGLRIHPASCAFDEKQLIGGDQASAFGIDEEQVPAFMAKWRSYAERIDGLHVFTSSNQLQAEKLLDHYAGVFALGEKFSRDYRLHLNWLDMGGGLGVPYRSEDKTLDLNTLANGLHGLLNDNAWFTGQIVLEPGRWLSAPCGVYANPVRCVKSSRDQRFVICAGGINHLMRPLLTGQAFPVRLLGQDGPTKDSYVLAGPLCTALDRLGVVQLPNTPRPGDWLIFGMCGAYGWSEAMPHFLSHAPAEQIWLR
jgi:diaminopimelate decarboxylase